MKNQTKKAFELNVTILSGSTVMSTTRDLEIETIPYAPLIIHYFYILIEIGVLPISVHLTVNK